MAELSKRRAPGLGHSAICLLVLGASFASTGRPANDAETIPRTVVFGGDADYPPFEWKQGGRARGFNIELERAIAKHGERDARHRLGDWPEIVSAFRAGDVDILPMFRSEARARNYHFSDPFYFSDVAAFSPPGASNIANLDQFSRVAVAVEKDSAAHDRLRTSGIGARIVTTADTLAALRAVADGQAEYALLNTLVAKRLIREQGLDLEQAGPPLWSRAYAFAVLRERELMAEWLDASLKRVIASGDFHRLQVRWENELEAKPADWSEVLATAALVALPLLVLAGVALGWNRLLRRTVAERTRALREELEHRRKAEEKVRHYANHEAITGLPRRTYFLELVAACAHSATRERPIGVAVVHLRNLGDVSRIIGHDAGEEAIRVFGQRLASLGLPATGHFGGRTYGAVLSGHDAASTFDRLSKGLPIGEIEFDPVVVAGVACAPEHGTNAGDLLRRAESALERVSGMRSSVVFYQPSMEPDPEELDLVREFRRTGGRGIHAIFQPQVSLTTGQSVGCEALVRWHHPRLGAISPARFVPLLERTGLIGLLTERMIDSAVAMAARLRAMGFECPVSINVSAHDLVEGDLHIALGTALARHDARAEDLKVELTETSFSENTDAVSQALEELRAIGVRSSIDDFGTGYASLAYLSQFQVDEVKIDRLFVEKLTLGGRHRSIVRATIAMAHDMGLIVVAEGAEDHDTLTQLLREGCDHVQGYVIARPLQEDDLISFLSNRG